MNGSMDTLKHSSSVAKQRLELQQPTESCRHRQKVRQKLEPTLSERPVITALETTNSLTMQPTQEGCIKRARYGVFAHSPSVPLERAHQVSLRLTYHTLSMPLQLGNWCWIGGIQGIGNEPGSVREIGNYILAFAMQAGAVIIKSRNNLGPIISGHPSLCLYNFEDQHSVYYIHIVQSK